MEKINVIEIDTRWGYKAFELYQGDIRRLDTPVDLLAVSVFAGDYRPEPRTVIGALRETYQIDLVDLLEDCEFDLRDAFSCWISREIPNPKFSRLLCVEMLAPDFSIEETIENVFVALSILEAKGFEISEFALPLLGTGSLGLDPLSIIDSLLDYSLKHMRKSPTLKRVKFVVREQERAARVSEAMDTTLGRVRLVLPKGEAVERLRARIREKIQMAELVFGGQSPAVFDDLYRIVSDADSRSFELGIAGRRLAEFVADNILKEDKQESLFRKLERLRKSSDPSIAEWITIYLHVLRVLGNEAAHEDEGTARVPPFLDESDLELCLFCIRRVLDFWLDFRGATS